LEKLKYYMGKSECMPAEKSRERLSFCRQPAPHLNVPQLNERRRRIYAAVAKAGPSGVSRHDLISEIYGEKEPPQSARTILRVQIHEANKSLREFNQRIKSIGRAYVLTELAQAS
jgi:hypothetical protein